jgi:hypothetical protein
MVGGATKMMATKVSLCRQLLRCWQYNFSVDDVSQQAVHPFRPAQRRL